MTAIEHGELSPPPSSRLALLNARLWILVVLSAAFAVAGYLQSDDLNKVVLWSFAGAVSGTAAAVRCIFWARGLRGRQAGRAVMTFIEHDAAPSFATDKDGKVRYQNAASIARIGPQAGVGATQAMAGFIANPDSLVIRLRVKAQGDGAAREDVVLPRGRLRVSVHRISDGLLWRFEDIATSAPATAGTSSAIPMLVVNPSEAILHINDVLRDMLEFRPKRLSDILEPTQLRSGAVLPLRGSEKRILAQVFVNETGSQERELYFFPTSGQTSDAATAIDPMFNSLPVPLLHLDAQGRVLRASRMALSILPGLEGETRKLPQMFEGLGRPISDWIADAAKGRGLNRAEVVRVTGVVPEQYLQVTLGRILLDGVTSLVAVLNDATELKTLEAQFVQSQKMQAIGQLAGGVAHDFNNLLTAISGHCDLLLLRHDKDDADYADLMQINQNANRAAALVGQLLAFSRKQTLQPERLDLRDSLSELTHLLNRLVGEKVQLTLSSDPGLLPIRADRRQLEQVLMNLVVNARDAMPDGGSIRVETQCDYLSEDLHRDRVVVPAGQYVVVRVIDTGVGIPPDFIGRIFEPFVTTKRTGEGTGLGLSMAYGIVKQTGGFIFADSVVGEGTEFSLYFPADDSVEDLGEPSLKFATAAQDRTALLETMEPEPPSVPTETKDAPEPSAPVVSRGHTEATSDGSRSGDGSDVKAIPASSEGRDGLILLVEDEAPVRAFASRALRMRGYTVMEAASGEDALEILDDATLAVDLFVTDVMMPGMDGPSWVRKAHETRPDVKTVFVSGYAQNTFAEDREAIPNSVFLPKPFSLAELTRTVQQQLVTADTV